MKSKITNMDSLLSHIIKGSEQVGDSFLTAKLDVPEIVVDLKELGFSPKSIYGFYEGESLPGIFVVENSFYGYSGIYCFINTSDSLNRGKTVFNELYSRVSKDYAVDLITAIWTSENYTSNLNTFNDLISKGISLEESALNTFTGKMSSRLGFSVPVVEGVKDFSNITYNTSKVRFFPEDSPLLRFFPDLNVNKTKYNN